FDSSSARSALFLAGASHSDESCSRTPRRSFGMFHVKHSNFSEVIVRSRATAFGGLWSSRSRSIPQNSFPLAVACSSSFLTPAHAGIQTFENVTCCLDPGFRRGDDNAGR